MGQNYNHSIFTRMSSRSLSWGDLIVQRVEPWDRCLSPLCDSASNITATHLQPLNFPFWILCLLPDNNLIIRELFSISFNTGGFLAGVQGGWVQLPCPPYLEIFCNKAPPGAPWHTVVSLPYPIHLGEKITSEFIQNSKVVNLRCQKVHQYCKYYPKY